MIDFGTGSRRLASSLFKDPNVQKPFKIHAFLTHTHWDHIMGFPFFGPLHVPTSVIDIYAPVPMEGSLESIVAGQLTYKYFPVRFEELQSKINYHPLKEGEMELPGGMKISYIYLNHPILCLGYRFEYEGKTFATCYDHEPFINLFEGDPDNEEEGRMAADEQNKRVSDFYKGVDVLVHDAQYTSKEYNKFRGWGHSTYNYAINQSVNAGVKKLCLFHHDPERSDKKLDILNKHLKEKFAGSDIDVMVAYEGLEIDLN